MITNALKTSLRHLWRFRLYTVLNILGLALSISASWIIYRIVDHEFSFDAKLPENIYRVVSLFPGEKAERSGGISAPLYQAVKNEVAGLKSVVPVFSQWVNSAQINDGKKTTVKDGPTDIVATQSDYFKMLPYRWLAGDKNTALSQPQSVVLAQSRAAEYFPGLKPGEMLNKTITYFKGDTVVHTVRGVVADYAENTQFTGKEFLSLKDKSYELPQWTNTNGTDRFYIQLAGKARATTIARQINAAAKTRYKLFEKESKFLYQKEYQLLPVKEVHFATDINDYGLRKASKPVMYGLSGIAFFLLLLACINYINLNLAQIPQRSKEVGVRKTLGGSRSHLIRQFLNETWLTVILAFILSFVISRAGFSFLGDIIPVGVTLFGSVVSLLYFLIGMVGFLTVFAGLYPSWLVTRLKAVEIFNKVKYTQGSQFHLQKFLIVFQFVIALVFISSAWIVGRQLQFTLHTDMGFNKDAVVLVNVPYRYLDQPEYKDRQFTLLDRIKKLKGVEDAAMGTAPLSDQYSSSPFEYRPKGKEPVGVQMFKKWIDPNYLPFYKMKLLAGQNIHASDTTVEFIINETALHSFGFKNPQDVIGKMIAQKGNTALPVTGVVKDFYSQDFRTKIEPLAMMTDKGGLYTFNIRLSPEERTSLADLMNSIRNEWSKFYPKDSFEWSIYDETLEKLYKSENQLSRLINISTIAIIFISCLGLFGLAALSASQRTKEIGIRKVLGASVNSIVSMLSKEYAVLVFIAAVIATPLAWWAAEYWLRDFVYRIPVSWWIFAGAAIAGVILAFATISFQAVKAALANPVKSLRTE